ncbi:MAG: hypothetical protein M3R09_04360 [Actinomycetota bacterium]|nr:hypothetical protein [Actinomycetota bacterium]
MPSFSIEQDDAARPDVVELARTDRAWASQHSPPEDVHAVEAEALLHPDVTVLGARDADGALLGMGALRELDADHAELKAMHVRDRGRGRRVGSLYTSLGFTPCPPFGRYVASRTQYG